MQRTIDTVLELEHPQLAVLNGDIIVGGFNIPENLKQDASAAVEP
jgi:hypothetical protein